ncbi:hypothetical protein BX600DRAFT_292519 [Xylariales sp. PMI_506]|nr:hypothetical protein BX600DRAFT_292519 [Xylariales sp. PMI_506]
MVRIMQQAAPRAGSALAAELGWRWQETIGVPSTRGGAVRLPRNDYIGMYLLAVGAMSPAVCIGTHNSLPGRLFNR